MRLQEGVKMSKNGDSHWVFVGAVLGFVGVSMGAFGAHALEDILTEHYRTVYDTASKYALVHAVMMCGLGLVSDRAVPRLCFWAFLVGVCIFSGSLWLLSITEVKWLGAITPIGGVLLLVGWGRLAWWGKNGCE